VTIIRLTVKIISTTIMIVQNVDTMSGNVREECRVTYLWNSSSIQGERRKRGREEEREYDLVRKEKKHREKNMVMNMNIQ